MQDSRYGEESFQKKQFQKYPKNYYENKHFQSQIQKLLPNENDNQQEIITFPSSRYEKWGERSSLQNRLNSNSLKKQRSNGKMYQTIPIRTISYANTIKYEKISQPKKIADNKCKSEGQNKFNSKSLFINMKKLKDLRKNNYKNGKIATQRNNYDKKIPQIDEINLDLFRLTSTNLRFKDRKHEQSPEETQHLRKLTQTQGGKRNVIKFNGSSKSKEKKSYFIDREIQNQEENLQASDYHFLLQPTKSKKSRTDQKSTCIEEPTNLKAKHTPTEKQLGSDLELTGFKYQMRKNDEQHLKNFVRYSQVMIDSESQLFSKGLKKLKSMSGLKSKSKQPRQILEHVSSPFKATFRIKHIDDNKNILLTTIKKKTSTMKKEQLVQFIKKVVQ